MSQVTRCLTSGHVRSWLLGDWAGWASSCTNTPHYELSWEHVVGRGIKQRQNTDVHSGMCHGLSASTRKTAGHSRSRPIIATVAVSPFCFYTSSLFSLPSLSLELLWFLISIFQVAG